MAHQEELKRPPWTANKSFCSAREIPSFLVSGSYLCKWDEDASHLQDCLVKVDENGFFLSYQEDDKEAVCVDLCHVSDIRGGLLPKDSKTKDALQFLGNDPLETCTLTIIHGQNLVDNCFLNFMFASTKTAQEWTHGLRSLVYNRSFQNADVMMLLRKQYSRICCSLNANKKISLKTISKLLYCSKSEQRISDMLETMGVTLLSKELEPSELTMELFFKLYLLMCPRTDIDTVFLKRSGGKSIFLSQEQFLTFLNKEQRDHRLNETIHPLCDISRANTLLQKFEPSEDMASKGRMTMEGLYRFFMSEECSVIKSSSLSLGHDMTHPITDYFINSSHNTYLVGRQFGGKSSVEMYRQSLLAGCRCIELDCWDGPGDEPIITHGKAMCTNVLFQDVIYAIKEAAFVTSPYPVLLSFENRCSRSQQRKLARYCLDIFGDILVTKPLESNPLELGKRLPSPEQLLYRILIKNKKLRVEIEQLELMQMDPSETGTSSVRDAKVPILNGVVQVEDAIENDQSVNSAADSDSLQANNNKQDLLMRPCAPVKRLSIISERSLDDADGANCMSLPASPRLPLVSRMRSSSDTMKVDVDKAIGNLFFTGKTDETSASPPAEGLVKLIINPDDGSSLVQTDPNGIWHCEVRRSSHDTSTSQETSSLNESSTSLEAGESSHNSTQDARLCTETIFGNEIITTTSTTSAFMTQESEISLDSVQLASHQSSVVSSDSDASPNKDVYRNARENRVSSNRSLQSVTSSDSSIDVELVDTASPDVRLTKRGISLTSHGSTSSSSSKAQKKTGSGRSPSLTPTEDEPDGMLLQSKTHIDPLLSSLVNYIQPCPFPGFEQSEERNMCYKMSSFNESSAFSVLKGNPIEFNKYNCRQFTRIYPKGSRVDSSNYNPQVFWNVGCQMVSLNLQTPDLPFQLNQGKFEANGQCGYLLKPEVMRQTGRMFDAFTESPLDGIVPTTISVKVISGQFLTEKRVNTYALVEVYGLPTDTGRKNKTRSVASRGQLLNWIYDTNPFVFRKIVLPELALIRFAVFDENDKLLGQRVLPLDSIEPGYRHVPLRTEANLPCDMATLLVFFVLETYVPAKFGDIVNELFDPIKFQNEADKRAAQMQVFEMEEDEETDVDAHPTDVTDNGSDEGPFQRQRPQTIARVSGQASSRSRDSIVTLSMRSKSTTQVTHNTRTDIINGGEYHLQPVSLQELKKDKGYHKLVKRHQRELENIFKKHEKERLSLQRSHTSQVQKLVAVFEKNRQNEDRAYERALKKASEKNEEKLHNAYEQKLKYLKSDHQEKLSNLMPIHNQENADAVSRHVHEEVGVRCYQMAEQLDFLKQLLRKLQQDEEKVMKERHSREMAELERRQTRKSMEDSKSLSLDREIKSKEEKERRQRERDKINLQLFKTERQMKKKMASVETDKLAAKHREELERMSEEYNEVMAIEKEKYRDATAARKATFPLS